LDFIPKIPIAMPARQNRKGTARPKITIGKNSPMLPKNATIVPQIVPNGANIPIMKATFPFLEAVSLLFEDEDTTFA